MTLRDEIAQYSRQSRLFVIQMLDEAVDDGCITECDADELLLEWDVDHFPDQIPKPVCEAIKQRRYAERADGYIDDDDD